MSILDIGAGAAGGLQQLLAQQLAEEKMAEEARSNRAREVLTGRQIDESAASRQDTNRRLTDTARVAAEDRDAARVVGKVNFRPVGAVVTPQEEGTEIKAGIPSGMYSHDPAQLGGRGAVAGVTPPSLGPKGGSGQMTTPATDISTDTKPAQTTWVGTEAQQEAHSRLENVGADNVERVEVPGPGGRKIIKFIPKKGIGGQQFEGYVPPKAEPQPVVINTGDGPQLLDRGKGTTRQITDADGNVVTAADPAQVKMQKRNAGSVRSHITNISKEAEEVDKLGLLGPIGSRWAEFANGDWGSVKDLNAIGFNLTDAQAQMVTKFRDDIGLLQSGMAMVHGGQRGGGSIAMNQKMEGFINAKKMDLNGVKGALSSFDEWLATYQADPAKAIGGTGAGGATADPMGDLYQKYLNGAGAGKK